MATTHVFALLAGSLFLLDCGNDHSAQDNYRALCNGLHPVADFCQIPTFTVKPDSLSYPLTAEDDTIEITSSRPIAHDYGEYLEAHAVQRDLSIDLLVFGESEAYQNFDVVLFGKIPRPPSPGRSWQT